MAVDSVRAELESKFKERELRRGVADLVDHGRRVARYIQTQMTYSLAAKYRMPAISAGGEFVDNGGLMSYGPDRIETVPAWGGDGRQDS